MEYEKGLTSVFLGMDIEESEEPKIALGLYDDGAEVAMLAKSEADRSEAICERDDVFYKFDIFEGIFVDVVRKNDGDGERAFTSAVDHCPATNGKETLGGDALVT